MKILKITHRFKRASIKPLTYYVRGEFKPEGESAKAYKAKFEADILRLASGRHMTADELKGYMFDSVTAVIDVI